MTNLPLIPEGRDWTPETWRAGLDEAVRRIGFRKISTWSDLLKSPFALAVMNAISDATIAHAATLLDAGIVKPPVSEAVKLLGAVVIAYRLEKEPCLLDKSPAAIVVIQSALDKARLELVNLLIEADRVIVWESHGLGRDFSDKVEAALDKARAGG